MTHTTKRVARMAMLLAVAAIILLGAASTAFAATTYEKRPGGTTAEIKSAIFYIAVDTGTDGTGDRYYYYFTLDELKDEYGVESRDFDYTNHTVGTVTSAHGFSIVALVDSLVGPYGHSLGIDDTWSVQYLEEDAYHATGSQYIDTLANAADTTKPMLTYEIKETYTVPTFYNVNDTEYSWAENLYPEYLRVYRQTDSANSSVMKMMMGIAVSPDGNAFNDDTAGKYDLTGTDGFGNQVVLNSKGNAGREVLGAMAGMTIGVQAPSVAGYTASEGSQIIAGVEPEATSTQTVNFSYTPYTYLTTKNWTSGASQTYTEYDIASATSTVTIPESLEYVEGLVASGEAAYVDADSFDDTTAEFTIAIPARQLFVDTRVSPYAYGFTDLNLYRYTGASAYVLAGLGATSDVANLVVTDTDGAKKLLEGDAATNAFVAYKDSHSKACPNNTSENKRFTWVYDNPALIDGYDGDVLVTSVARVDANAPLAKKVKIRTRSGAKKAKLRRGRRLRLVATTSPAKTIEKLIWKSSKPGIAKVNANGKVVASKKRTGKVVITVKSTFGKKARFVIRVRR